MPERPNTRRSASGSDIKFDLGAYAYAHRGLWNDKRPENSLAAFEAAVAEDLAVELDVRITGDGELVVFHDATLERMCGDAARVNELTLAELKARALPDGSRVPTLGEALEVMSGLPLLVEIKIDAPADGGARDRTATKVIELLRQTRAPAAVMSFDEPTVHRLTHELPGRPVGQLIEPLHRLGEDGVRALVRRALEFGSTIWRLTCPRWRPSRRRRRVSRWRAGRSAARATSLVSASMMRRLSSKDSVRPSQSPAETRYSWG